MSTETTNRFAALNAIALENLTKETTGTVAVAAGIENAKPIFTAANLWNIHNQRRVRAISARFVS